MSTPSLLLRVLVRRLAAVTLPTFLFACAAPSTSDDGRGILVMAHGGDAAWDAAVLQAVESLQADLPCEVAFGMATADTLQDAVARLEQRGVREVAVVRLFVSGESFRDRTEQILGLQPGAPDRPLHEEHANHASAGHSMAFWRIDSQASFVLSDAGLLDNPRVGEILASRALALSREPPRESVLIVAHGPGDDAENERWLARMEQQARAVAAAASFRAVHVETLREDWPEKREASEQRIRAFVEQAAAGGGTAIVIPYRVHGFGPYAEVLEGLPYVADERGFLPHPAITEWIREQAWACLGQDAPGSS